MHPFTFSQVTEAGAAIKEATGHPRAQFVAGGSNLVDFMKLNVLTPEELIDINDLALAEIDVHNDVVRIGAMVRNSDLAYHEVIRQRFPVLSEALLAGASAQVRNVATVGGNLMQRPRCTYFRDVAWNCNMRHPGTGCAALDGYNRSHAILGVSDKCIATHPSDMCVALAAIDTVILTEGSQGKRRIPFGEFHIAYGDDPARNWNLLPGELITAIEIPNTPFFAKSHYLKVRDRASFEFALTSVAVALHIRDGKIAAARLALGGVATKPWRSVAAEKVLVGASPGKSAFTAAAQAALREARTRKHNAFKVELAKRTIVRTLMNLTASTES